MLQLSKEDIEAIADAVAARSRHASGAQPDSACDEIGWLVEITGPRYWTGTPGCGNWTADSRAAMRFARRQDAEAACRHLAPSGAIPVEHAWVSHRPAGAQPSGAPAPASAQGEVCECGHGVVSHAAELCSGTSNTEYGWCRCSKYRPTPPSIEKTGESASSGSASGRTTVLNADAPASPASVAPMQIHEYKEEDGRVTSVDVWPLPPEDMTTHGFATFYGPNARVEAERYLASRAPRASTVSVEDGSVRDVAEDVLSWLDECKLDGEDGQLRERLRAALAAMPASEATQPAPSPQPEREAQGEPPTIEECRAAFDQACEDALKNPRLSRRAADYEGVAAVRTLCLSRAPSPSPALGAKETK